MSVLAAAQEITAPSVEYRQLAPILIVLGAAVVGVLVEAFVPRAYRRTVQIVLALASLVVALVYVVTAPKVSAVIASGSVADDGPGRFLQAVLLVVSILGALLIAERGVDPAGDAFAPRASALPGSEDEREFTARGWLQTEVWPLMLFSVGGMLLFVVSNDLLTMFVALEVMSLPLYLLAGMARRRRLLSQEAAMKYFLLGAFASAFFLYGSALVYGFAKSVSFGAITEAMAADPGRTGLLLAGMGLLIVGLLFKVAAVPFHQWTPDVYQGAPTAVTGFMAAGVKVAAFGALLRLTYVAFGGMRDDWRPVLWIIAIITMIIGAVLSLAQSDVKRMLAYSSVAHAGFLLLGVIAASSQGLSATLFYLAVYGLITIGAFGIVSLVRDSAGEATHLSQWAGLGKTSPLVAGIMAIFLLALAGIPLTSGFNAKFSIFSAAASGGGSIPVIFGVIASMIAAFFYLRVIVLMFFSEPAENAPSVVVPSIFTSIAVGVGFLSTIVLGLMPQPLLDLANNAGIFVR